MESVLLHSMRHKQCVAHHKDVLVQIYQNDMTLLYSIAKDEINHRAKIFKIRLHNTTVPI